MNIYSSKYKGNEIDALLDKLIDGGTVMSGLSSLESDVSGLTTNVTGLSGNVTTLTGRISTLEYQYTSLSDIISTETSNRETGDNALGLRIDDVDNDIEKINGNITTIQGQITNLET